MDSDSLMDSFDEGASSDFVAPAKPVKTAKAKAAPPKKPAGTAKPRGRPPKDPSAPPKPRAKAPPKKKAVIDSDDENSEADAHMNGLDGDESLLADTPPKKKKAPAPKKKAGQPLTDIPNESFDMADGIEDDPPAKGKKAAGGSGSKYQMLTHLEHIMKRPDTYIGSVERTDDNMWVYNSETDSMQYRKVSYVPGLYKIFDEILVNAADNKQNDKNMSEIRVTVDRESGEISVRNDGKGIPIEIHKEHGIYVPEMIFGHLLTSSNYDDDQAKITGGRNGYGAKLCNVFSKEFTLETVDSKQKKKYKQTWTENMSKMGKAKITDIKSDDYTKVTYRADFAKFGMTGIDDDFEALVKRRTYDIAGTLRGVKVYLNGDRVKVNSFAKYMEMYTKAIRKEQGDEEEKEKEVIITDRHDRWDIGFAVSDGSFNQVSFVNSIATTSGGTHVNYIADQITEKLLAIVNKKNKGGVKLKPAQIKNHIFLFVNCSIVNPAFTSQTKEQLTTKHTQFGSKPVLSDKFLKAIEKTAVIQNIMHFAQQKADQMLKKTDGNKRSRMNNSKLTDANRAGTKDGHLCTLILTEGDSAALLALAGRALVSPDHFGVFPLRGKILNVRDASIDQISKNQEIQNIKKFIGLQHKKEYTDTKGLRYGHLMIMTDQDHDGSHIKGLLINFLQCQFPSLLKIPDFLLEFITPIVKVWKGDPKYPKQLKSFFSMPEYEEWKLQHQHEKGWDHKYFKGLGTSDFNKDAEAYFGDLDTHMKAFHTMREQEEALIELAFSKKKADARKEWLREFVPGQHLDITTREITYDDFVNKELILFSMADNLRSIPSVIDGFKPGQRKVLYTCFKLNLKKETKVVALAGTAMSMTDYAHGETSMQGTIIGLAQTFVGSNNINCLEPGGNFGSRLQGGSDAASARYIFTRLSPFARKVFHPEDDALLKYGESDGDKIEPEMYVPILPMILVNGADGIGTGWSSSVPNYNPLDIVENLRIRMQDGSTKDDMKMMMPWFRGFTGTIEDIGNDRYKFTGTIRQTGDNEIEITELPVRMWSQWFKDKLEDIIKAEKVPSFIKDYTDYNTPNKVHFIIKMEDKHMANALAKGLEETFKLYNTQATSNLVAFDAHGRIHKYATVLDIMEEFYHVRLQYYEKRKARQLAQMQKELDKMTNQSRFIQMIIDGKLVVSKKKKATLVVELKKLGFTPFPKVSDAKAAGEVADAAEDDDDENDAPGASDYDYLLGMAIWSLTQERVDKLLKQIGDKEAEVDILIKLTPKDLWLRDLDAFEEEWHTQLAEEENYAKKLAKKGRRGSRKLGIGASKGGKRKKKRTGDSDSDDSESDYGPAKKKAKPKTGGLLSYLKKEDEPSKPSATAALKSGAVSGMKQTGMLGYLKKDAPPNLDGAADVEMSDAPAAAPPAASKKGRPAAAKAAKTIKPVPVDSESDEDVFAAVAEEAEKKKPAETTITTSRTARGAAKKATNYAVDKDSESDDMDDDFDISNMVQTIGGKSNDRPLFSTTTRPANNGVRPGSAAGGATKANGRAALSKLSPIEIDDPDETNYEGLVPQDSPNKPAPRNVNDTIISSDDDDFGFGIKKKAPTKPAAKPAASKSKAAAPKPAPKPKTAASTVVAKKTTQLSPAAKAYAARLGKTKDLTSKPTSKSAPKKPITVDSDEEDEVDNTEVLANDILSDEEEDEPTPKPKPAAARPGRRAAAKPAKYVLSDDDESDEVSEADFDDDSD